MNSRLTFTTSHHVYVVAQVDNRIAELEAREQAYISAGAVREGRIAELEAQLDVVRKWERRQRELIGVHVQSKKVDKVVDDVIQTFCDELLEALNGEDDG